MRDTTFRLGRLASSAALVLILGSSGCTPEPTGDAGASTSPTFTAQSTPVAPTPTALSTGTEDTGTFGAGCGSTPDFGPGSVEGLSKDDILTAAERSSELSTLVTLVKRSQLADTLSNTGDVTVFAPNNAAFKRVDGATLRPIVASRSRLTNTLLLHVVPGRLPPAQLAGTHQTLSGRSLSVEGSGEEFTVDGTTRVVCGNVQTKNGVIYVIDQVLLPE